MVARCGDDIWTLVESARGESLMVRRCPSLVANRKPLLFVFWNGERRHVPARGLLSRVLVIASQSKSYCSPICDVSIECEAVLPMTSRSAPASARDSDCDGFSEGL